MSKQQQDKITIYGPKADGTYIVEFKTTAGEALAISVPGSEAAVLKAEWAGAAGCERLRGTPTKLRCAIIIAITPSGRRDHMTAFIGRREFITLLGGAAAAWRWRRGRSRGR